MSIDNAIFRKTGPPKGFAAAYDTSAGIVRCSWRKVNFDGLWYVVRSVDKAFNPSVNAGPVEITVSGKD